MPLAEVAHPPTTIARGDEQSLFAQIITADDPWSAAAKLRLFRTDYQRSGEVLESGVNFFVLALESLGARPRASCEGHPRGFYVLFYAPYETALLIERAGYFTLEVSGRNEWVIRLNERGHEQGVGPLTDDARISWLRAAAQAWVSMLMSRRATR